jgi:chromosome segregation ATPase
MNWEYIVTAVISLVSGGTLTGLYLRKQTEGSATAGVVKESMEALKSALEMLTSQQERLNAIIKDKDMLIEQQQGLINEYKTALEEANQKLKNLEFKVSENDRKISGVQRTIDNEIRERKLAEHNICFVDDCKLRRPPLGTYKKETA